MEENRRRDVVVGRGVDEATQRQIVALLPRLRRFALSLTGNPTEADDLVQDTVERALKAIDRWEPGTRLDSWMYRIAQNQFIDGVRKRRHQRPAPVEEADLVHAVEGERATEAKIMLAKTMAAMQELPEDQRIAVSLVLVEGHGYQEAADILNVPIGTLTSRLARGRETLAKRLMGKT
jgi:RNA polymerase sigma factor (sigma-70 family)